jgi:hypothetical protein
LRVISPARTTTTGTYTIIITNTPVTSVTGADPL